MRWFWLILPLTACAPQEPPQLGGQSGSLRDDPLELPEGFEALNYAQIYADAMVVAGSATFATAWNGHLSTLWTGEANCPDLYLGAPEEVDMDDEDGEIVGMSWVDDCTTAVGDVYSGFAWWDNAITDDGLEGTRTMQADGWVDNSAGTTRFSFDGEGSDTLTFTGADWTYSTEVSATIKGVDAFGPNALTPSGFRANQVVTTYGSDGSLAMDGGLYLFDGPLQGKFDTIVLEAEFDDTVCADEPLGYVGIRDTEGFWYDLHFLPNFEEGDVAAFGYPFELIENPVCDGCGHLFIRGIDVQDQVGGMVCIDWNAVSTGLVPPDLSEFVLTLRELFPETP